MHLYLHTKTGIKTKLLDVWFSNFLGQILLCLGKHERVIYGCYLRFSQCLVSSATLLKLPLKGFSFETYMIPTSGILIQSLISVWTNVCTLGYNLLPHYLFCCCNCFSGWSLGAQSDWLHALIHVQWLSV